MSLPVDFALGTILCFKLHAAQRCLSCWKGTTISVVCMFVFDSYVLYFGSWWCSLQMQFSAVYMIPGSFVLHYQLIDLHPYHFPAVVFICPRILLPLCTCTVGLCTHGRDDMTKMTWIGKCGIDDTYKCADTNQYCYFVWHGAKYDRDRDCVHDQPNLSVWTFTCPIVNVIPSSAYLKAQVTMNLQ